MRKAMIAVAFCLIGCTETPEQVQARQDQQAATCSGYGFAPGTEQFGMCMMTLDRDHAAAEQQRRVAMAAALQDTSNYYQQQSLIQQQNAQALMSQPQSSTFITNPTTTTNCVPAMGGGVTCTSY